MRRRTFIAALGGAAAGPLAARAQQSGSIRRVGIIMAGAEGNSLDTKNILAFRDGMRSLGWVEDKNVRFDLRWQAAGRERAEAAVADLTAIRCDVIVVGTIQAFLALRRLPSDSPIVFVNLPDPVATGLVSTIARTNSNFTGFTAYEYSITGKWLEFQGDRPRGAARRFRLRYRHCTRRKFGPSKTHQRASLKLARGLTLVNPSSPTAEVQSKDIQSAARQLGSRQAPRGRFKAARARVVH